MANSKTGSKGCKSKFIVEYTIPYVHRVMVGIHAKSSNSALGLGEKCFADGSIWDDTATMPLLFDDYEETDAPGVPVEFKVVEEVEEWPEADHSVKAIRRRDAAFRACVALLDAFREGSSGKIDRESLVQALNEARAASPGEIADPVVPLLHGETATVLVGIEGGLVTGATTNVPAQVIVLDYDLAKDGEGHDVQEIYWPDGSTSRAVLITHTADVQQDGFVNSVYEKAELADKS
jgi:hypothetical protein